MVRYAAGDRLGPPHHGQNVTCDHCDTRLDQHDNFVYRGHNYCCQCMSALCSWFLDGGFITDPDMFPAEWIEPLP